MDDHRFRAEERAHREFLQTFRGLLGRLGERLRSPGMRRVLPRLCSLGIGFFLSAPPVAGGHPLGLAYAAARYGREDRLFAALGGAGGALAFGGAERLYLFCAALVILAGQGLLPRRSAHRVEIGAGLAACAAAVGELTRAAFSGGETADLLLALCRIALTGLAAPVITAAFVPARKGAALRRQTVARLLLMGTVPLVLGVGVPGEAAGLSRAQTGLSALLPLPWGISLGGIFGFFAVGLLGLFEPASAPLFALVLGLFPDLSAGARMVPDYVVLLPLSAAAVAVLRPVGRTLACLFFMLCGAVCAVWVGDLSAIFELLIAGCLLLLLPARALARVYSLLYMQAFPGQSGAVLVRRPPVYDAELSAELSPSPEEGLRRTLMAQARAFSALADEFAPAVDLPDSLLPLPGPVREAVAAQYGQFSRLLQEAAGASGEGLLQKIRDRLRPGFSLSVEAVGVHAPGQRLRGDRTLCLRLSDGRRYVILADGMGHGAPAGKEAHRLLRTAERMLRAGVSPELAVEILSSSLYFSGGGCTFSTVDLLEFDEARAVARLIKCGSAPTYLCRDHGVTAVPCAHLPVGADHLSLREGVRELCLQAGDVLLMVSDGITDGEEDGWLRDLLRAYAHLPVGELAAMVLRSAPERSDDRTVIAIRVTRTV